MTQKTVLDFYADWCGPCDQQHDEIERLRSRTRDADEVTVEEIDIEEQMNRANEYNVRSVPTVVVEIDGEQVEQWTGVTSADQILDVLNDY